MKDEPIKPLPEGNLDCSHDYDRYTTSLLKCNNCGKVISAKEFYLEIEVALLNQDLKTALVEIKLLTQELEKIKDEQHHTGIERDLNT